MSGVSAAAPEVDFEVPLLAAFLGIKGVPWLAWGSTDVLQRLELGEKGVTWQVFRPKFCPYSSIQLVDYRSTVGTANILLMFRNSLVTFSGNTGDPETARDALRRLQDKGSNLSSSARVLVDQGLS